jgi:uncharacterized protein (UPF0332 family)
MSLNEYSRDVIVNREMEKARHTLQVAVRLANDREWNDAAGRVYYALFHAVSALLIHDRIQVKSHKGAYAMLSMHYINTGKLPKSYGDFYRKMEILREKGDYDCFYDATEEEVVATIPQAREMIDAIAERIKS